MTEIKYSDSTLAELGPSVVNQKQSKQQRSCFLLCILGKEYYGLLTYSSREVLCVYWGVANMRVRPEALLDLCYLASVHSVLALV